MEDINKLNLKYNSQIFTKQDINDKILSLRTPPLLKNTPIHYAWIRLNARFTIVQYQTSHILYLRAKDTGSNKRVIAVEDMYETLKRIHIEMNHCDVTDSIHEYFNSFTASLNMYVKSLFHTVNYVNLKKLKTAKVFGR